MQLHRAAWCLLLAAAAWLPCAAVAQSSATKVSGAFDSSISNGGSNQGFFNCTGFPVCSGTYLVARHDSGCPNTFRLSDTITIDGLALAQPGKLQGTVTLDNLGFRDGINADGTCFIRPGTSSAITLAYTGNWNGNTGAFTMIAHGDQNQRIEINGVFTADVPNAAAVFPMTVTRNIDFDRADVSAHVNFRSQDVNTNGSIYVFAVAPATRVKNLEAAKGAAFGLMARGSPKDTPVQCVIAQLTSSGELQATLGANLQPAATNVLSSQGQAVTVLNNVATPQVAGATFFVGYGPSAAAMINNGINRSAVTVPGAQTCFPAPPQAGWWWNPAESGRGYSLEVQGNNIFFASYLYDATGRSTWLAAAGPLSLDGSLFNGRLLALAGGQTLTGAYRAPAPATDAGAITLAFNDASHGAMVWPGGAVPIERFNIVASGLAATPLTSQPESGWWWNAQENGRGFFLEWQGASAFVAGYMYDASGNPLWYASFLTTPNPLLGSGAWTQFANGQTLTGAYKPAAQVNDSVGALVLQFQGATSGTMTLPDGRQIAITRFRF